MELRYGDAANSYVVCGTVPHRTSKQTHYKNRFGSSQMHGYVLINYYYQMKACTCMHVRYCDLVYVFIICVTSLGSSAGLGVVLCTV